MLNMQSQKNKSLNIMIGIMMNIKNVYRVKEIRLTS